MKRWRLPWLLKIKLCTSRGDLEMAFTHLESLRKVESDTEIQCSLKHAVIDMLDIKTMGEVKDFIQNEWCDVSDKDRHEYARAAWDEGYNLDLDTRKAYMLT